MMDQGEVEQLMALGMMLSEDDQIAPTGVPRAAQDLLEAIITAFGEGFLPQYRIRLRPRKKLGRSKPVENQLDDHAIVDEYRQLMAAFPHGSMALERRLGEPADEFKRRIREIVLQLHENGWHWHQPLSSDVAYKIASHATQKRVSPQLVAYGLLAFYKRKTVGQIRGIIERSDVIPPTRRRGRLQ
jgi:hypothetical protein